LLYSLRWFHAERRVALIRRVRPQNLDCLVNKLRWRIIGTLFIKLELILRQWPDVLVNRTLALTAGGRERCIKRRPATVRRRSSATTGSPVKFISRNDMAEPRKVFRIEQPAAARRARPVPSPRDLPHQGEIMQALGALQAMMTAVPALPAADAAAPHPFAGHDTALQTEDMTRIADELDAVTTGTAQATQKILAAAEEIDQLADNLSAALKGKLEQELAQDIADSVLRIFEACNFQDLISQRVGKVMKALASKDATPAADGAPDVHGPRLDGDKGHLSQSEIDAMFGN
jgi:hypothetical protein